MNRIDRPRFDVRGNVLATFHPRAFNGYNCRCGKLVMRKYRGKRFGGRAQQEAIRAYRRRLTSEQIDQLARATSARMVLLRKPIALDRRTTPLMGVFEGIPLYAEEFNNEL